MENILLIGKPNSGKTLLFNRLTGLNQKVANYPGVTVELKSGHFDDYELVDYPGIYSLSPITKDEEIAIDRFHEALHDENNAIIICNLDATRLERSLVFGLQAQHLAQEHHRPFVFTLNMIDELEKKGRTIDVVGLSRELKTPVFALSAKTQKGLKEFKYSLKEILREKKEYIPKETFVSRQGILKRSKELGEKFSPPRELILKNQNALDYFFLNNIFGGVVFLIVMALLFQSIFTWSAPMMDLIEEAMTNLAPWVTSSLSPGPLKDFIQDAVFGGLGSFLVFIPQIMVLTFIIGLLEDSGYLARAALICHRPLSFFGLTGKSFIPYLSGHACAIPAIMAARTIESPRKRLITILTVPFMSCSARLPVYALFIVAFIPPTKLLGGLLSYRALAFLSLYLFGIFMALVVSVLITRFSSRPAISEDLPFILELPPYRLPHWRPLLLKTLESGKTFVTKAGGIIFSVTVIVWALGYFPNGDGALKTSWLATLGKGIEPLFAPLGLDWRYGVAILTSFLAREVFVGTLGTLFGIEGAEDNLSGLASNIQADGLSLGTGIGLLVLYAIALQCVSTVAVIKQETGSSKIAIGAFIGYGLLAYILAVFARFLILTLS